jgi:hypothetical protein
VTRAWFIPSPPDPADGVEVLRCESCRSIEIKIRTSTTQRLDGGRPLAHLECLACGHTWKVIGKAPIRALVVRLQQTPSQS